MDLGVKEWPTSIGYMLQKYPAHFDEVYGFECCTPAPPSIRYGSQGRGSELGDGGGLWLTTPPPPH